MSVAITEAKQSSSVAVVTKYNALAAMGAKQALVPFQYVPLPLKDNEVEIAIAACGVCHSDLHAVHDDFKFSAWPCVPGHEIVGEVIAIGSAVTTLKVGNRVGSGGQIGACNLATCRHCSTGQQQMCGSIKFNFGFPTGDSRQPITFGGFASHVRVPAQFAYIIPDGLSTVGAAPLLCAGITSWSPLIHNGVKAGDRVGIIGVGGLGHLGLQFAVKLGAHTTGISTSANKKAEVLGYGAQGFLDMSDSKAVAAAAGTFDFLLSTISSADVNWDAYLGLLRTEGTLCLTGLGSSVKFNPFSVIFRRLKIVGSLLASAKETNDMLAFCAKHNIVATTEEMAMTPANATAALARVEANLPRYRVVLVNRDNGKLADTTA